MEEKTENFFEELKKRIMGGGNDVEEALDNFLKACPKDSLSLEHMKDLIYCPNEIFIKHFPEILEKCSEKIFDSEFVSEVFKIRGIVYYKEVALKFLKCCNEEVFNDKCFGNFKIKCTFGFDKEIILELIRVCDSETIKCKLSDIKLKCEEKELDENILKAVLSKFENGEISDDFLNKILEHFSTEVIQNNLINILEKCDKKILDSSNLQKLLNKLLDGESSEESVIWIFSNFSGEFVKKYLCKIFRKLKGTSSNEEFLNLVLEKGDMSSNLPNLLFEKFGENLLKGRLVDILKECSDNKLFEKNCKQILNYFKENDDDDYDYEISGEVVNELVRCVNNIGWIFQNLDNFRNKNSNEEFLKAILKKLKLKVIAVSEFNDLLEYFNDEIIKDNLIDILQNLDKEEGYSSGYVLNKVLNLYQLPDKMPVELSFFLFENFNGGVVKENFLNILQRSNSNILSQENSNDALDMFANKEISDDLAKELIRCFNAEVFDSENINKFLGNCNENFNFDETTTEKFYKCFEKQSVTSEILVKLLNRGFQFDVKVCKEDNFQIFDIDIFISENYKDLSKKLHDKSAVKNFAALYNSYNKSNAKIGYGIGIGIGLLILLIAGGLSIATFGLGALTISPVVAIAAIAVTATVGLVITSVFCSLMHLLRLNLAKIIKNFIEQKYQDIPIYMEKKMEEEIAPDMRFWLKAKESKSKNTKDETREPLLKKFENQID